MKVEKEEIKVAGGKERKEKRKPKERKKGRSGEEVRQQNGQKNKE